MVEKTNKLENAHMDETCFILFFDEVIQKVC